MRRTWPSGRIKYNCFLQTISHHSWWGVKDRGRSLPVAVSCSFFFCLVKNTIVGRLSRRHTDRFSRGNEQWNFIYMYNVSDEMITIIIIIVVNRHALLPSATMIFSQSRDSRRDLHLSLSQPFTAGTQTQRALHGSFVAIISSLLTIGQTHRVSSSSSSLIFFQKYIYADYLGFRRRTERRCFVQSMGLIFFSSLRGYTALLPFLSNISFIA